MRGFGTGPGNNEGRGKETSGKIDGASCAFYGFRSAARAPEQDCCNSLHLECFLKAVPAALGFGSQGKVLRPTEHVPDKQGSVPPNAELEYDIELVRVSVPPT